jgi:hypothetical protein
MNPTEVERDESQRRSKSPTQEKDKKGRQETVTAAASKARL